MYCITFAVTFQERVDKKCVDKENRGKPSQKKIKCKEADEMRKKCVFKGTSTLKNIWSKMNIYE